MISVSTSVIVEAALLESLASDLHDVADLATALVAPEKAEAAQAALAGWSPVRLARSIAAGMVAAA